MSVKKNNYLNENKFEFLKLPNVDYCTKENKAYKMDEQKDLGNSGKAGPDQVLNVFNVLSNDVRH